MILSFFHLNILFQIIEGFIFIKNCRIEYNSKHQKNRCDINLRIKKKTSQAIVRYVSIRIYYNIFTFYLYIKIYLNNLAYIARTCANTYALYALPFNQIEICIQHKLWDIVYTDTYAKHSLIYEIVHFYIILNYLIYTRLKY